MNLEINRQVYFQFLMKIHKNVKLYEENGKGLYVIKIRSVFRCHNMHQYQLHGSHTERQARILTGNRKNREIYLEKYRNTEIQKYRNIYNINTSFMGAIHNVKREYYLSRNEEAGK